MKEKRPRGFAAMDPELRSEIARLGGEAVDAAGTGHRFKKGSAEASAAGRKGGKAVQKKIRERKRKEEA